MRVDQSVPRPSAEAVDRLRQSLRLSSPIVALYDAPPGPEFEPILEPAETTCCFAYYGRWAAGETLLLRRGGPGCPGAHRAFGLEKTMPPFMAHFLSDGVGAPAGEGLKATPDIAQAILDQARPVDIERDAVLVGPLRVAQWDLVRSVTFFVNGDRMAALTTLAGYWSSNKDVVVAPFASGCASLLRALSDYDDDRVVLGGLDAVMRVQLPEDLMTLTVSPARFARMLTFPEDSFLFKPWWAELMRQRQS
jgi:hypothetical protein